MQMIFNMLFFNLKYSRAVVDVWRTLTKPRPTITAQSKLTTKMEIVYQPEPSDVLCGRGKNSFRHIGNRHFRRVILEKASLYRMAETKQQKTQIVLLVCYTIMEGGGRFLIRNNDGKSWRKGGLKQAKMKAGHAFRDVVRGRFQRLQGTMKTSWAQPWRECAIQANEYARSNQINDITLQKATSSIFSLSPMPSTIEPLKGWKTGTMDPELAMEVLDLLIVKSLLELPQSM